MTSADLEVTHHFVDRPGIRIHHVERGEGPVVLLLHFVHAERADVLNPRLIELLKR